jgi:hypothetical protein
MDTMENSIRTSSGGRMKTDEIKLRLQSIIDGIASAAYSISGAALGTHRELADEAKYFETQTNSIQDYKARYQKMPLMPLSLITSYYRSQPADFYNRRLPVEATGTTNFKFMYGTRKLLGISEKYSPEDAPGLREIVSAYNSSASASEKLNIKRYEGLADKIINCTRLVEWIKYTIAPFSFAAEDNVFKKSLNIQDAIQTYSVTNSPEVSVSVVESSSQNDTIIQMTRNIKQVGATGSVGIASSRENDRILNIIDMNIMPINVHALMRTFPLAPTYNYAYSFEQEAALMYGESIDHLKNVKLDVAPGNPDAAKNTRQAFLKMINDPYCSVHMDMYGRSLQLRDGNSQGLIQRIFRGDDSLLMGRPKFVSDQLYNKALFGSLVPTRQDFNESGPLGAGRMEALVGQVVNPNRVDQVAQDAQSVVPGRAAVPAAARARGHRDADAEWNIRGTDEHMRGTAPRSFQDHAMSVLEPVFAAIDGPAGNTQQMKNIVKNALDAVRDGDFTDGAVSAIAFIARGKIRGIPNIDSLDAGRDKAKTIIDNAIKAIMRRSPTAYGVLTYLGPPDAPVKDNPIIQTTVLKRVQLGKNAEVKLRALDQVGKLRFDTTIVRNLFFVSNVQRLLRLKMQQELTMYRNVLVSSHQMVNPGITEYGSLPAASFAGSRRERAIYAANEVSTSRSYGEDNFSKYKL